MTIHSHYVEQINGQTKGDTRSTRTNIDGRNNMTCIRQPTTFHRHPDTHVWACASFATIAHAAYQQR